MNRRAFAGGLGAACGILATDGVEPSFAGGAGHEMIQLADCRMPAEDAAHERTLMQWPASQTVHGRNELAAVQRAIALIANTIARYEPVAVMAAARLHPSVRERLQGKVELWDIATDDLWCRDSGPTIVKTRDGRRAVAHIAFNGWGNKQRHPNDGQIAGRVAERLGHPLLSTGLVGEQGGVENDGDGTLLAHASSWVNPNRNRGSEDEIGKMLLTALGGQKIIWAPGIKGADITDYHIDALARFISPGRVLIQLPAKADPRDPWSISAFETYAILKQARDAKGRKLEIIVLPEPVNIRARESDFVASYVNYYVCNGAVISAEFGDDRADAAAHMLLGQLYPNREIVALNVDPIGRAGGGIHCATQQLPAPGAL